MMAFDLQRELMNEGKEITLENINAGFIEVSQLKGERIRSVPREEAFQIIFEILVEDL